jgi:hypothetical protein
VNKALFFIVVLVVITVGASVTVIVKTERDKTDDAMSRAISDRSNLAESRAANQQLQTQLGLTRESLNQTQDQLQTEILHVTNVQDSSQELRRTCRTVGQFTHGLMQTVRVQTRAVNQLLKDRRNRARALLHSVAHHLKHAQRTLERSGHAKIHDMLEACSGTR